MSAHFSPLRKHEKGDPGGCMDLKQKQKAGKQKYSCEGTEMAKRDGGGGERDREVHYALIPCARGKHF